MKTMKFYWVFSVLAVSLFGYQADDQTLACWNFNAPAARRTADESGFGNTIKLCMLEKAPVPVWVDGKGLRFDGQGGYAEIQAQEALNITDGDFSIEMKFMFENDDAAGKDLGGYLIGNKSYSEKKSGFSISYSTWQRPEIIFQYAFQGRACKFVSSLPEMLKAGRWYDLCISRSGDSLRCFLNNRELGNIVQPGELNLQAGRRIKIGIYPTPWQRDKNNRLKCVGFCGVIQAIRISDTGRREK